MTIPEILKELELYTERFPMAAMQAAIEQREAITPELLRVLETVAEDPVKYAEDTDYMLHIFAMFLLAQFREKRAYPVIVKMVSASGKTPSDLLGDMVAHGLSRILGSVYNGNLALLHGLVENEAVYEFVRSSALDALLVLERSGQMPRTEVVEYFRSLFHGKLQRIHSYAWDGLISSVADLPAPELLEAVRQAYADGLADNSVARLEEIERDISNPKSSRRDRKNLIVDAIAETEWWAAFHPGKPFGGSKSTEIDTPLPLPSLPPAPMESTYAPPQPFVREPKIGRNDPCPCGRGRKYKKCCGK